MSNLVENQDGKITYLLQNQPTSFITGYKNHLKFANNAQKHPILDHISQQSHLIARSQMHTQMVKQKQSEALKVIKERRYRNPQHVVSKSLNKAPLPYIPSFLNTETDDFRPSIKINSRTGVQIKTQTSDTDSNSPYLGKYINPS